MTEVYLNSIKDNYINRYISLNYKKCLVYGKIENIDLLGWSINVFLVAEGGTLNYKQYENRTIFISLNSEFEFEFISIDEIIRAYEKELSKNPANLFNCTLEQKSELLRSLIYEYDLMMGYRPDKIELKSVIEDSRLLNALGRRNLSYLEDIAKLTEKEFKSIFGIGSGYVVFMKGLLNKNGLAFKCD